MCSGNVAVCFRNFAMCSRKMLECVPITLKCDPGFGAVWIWCIPDFLLFYIILGLLICCFLDFVYISGGGHCVLWIPRACSHIVFLCETTYVQMCDMFIVDFHLFCLFGEGRWGWPRHFWKPCNVYQKRRNVFHERCNVSSDSLPSTESKNSVLKQKTDVNDFITAGHSFWNPNKT